MCGIVGFVGKEHAKEKILEGLRRLEYRGYDSAGMAVVNETGLHVKKHVGEISNLERVTRDPAFDGSVGIGHTRWATHGAPSDINSHPHVSEDGKIAVVHNGIIENHLELRDWLIENYGIKFKSETDTEVVAQLLSVYYDGNLSEAVDRLLEKIKGSYALAVVAADEPDTLVAVRKDAPMVAGLSKEGNFIASDIPALLKYVKEIYLIENNEKLILTKDDIKIYDAKGKRVKRDVMHVTWDVETAEKEGYEHFMLKEIHEQPTVLRDTLNKRLKDGNEINLDGIKMTKEDIEGFSKIYIVACGTAYHAGLVGKRAIEKMAKVPVEVDVASEFRYNEPFIDDNTLFIAISQSGETLDTLEALREAKRQGARVLSVVNVVESSVARESDDVFYTWAGPEIAVASTKGYTTQLMCMYLIALHMGITKGTLSKEEYDRILNALKEVPDKMEAYLEDTTQMQELGKEFSDRDMMFFVGRGIDSGVAYEGSLKMKEVSYINSFAIATGELKHGTMALVDKGTLIVSIGTQDFLYDKFLSNIAEVKTREAYVVALTKENNTEVAEEADDVIYIPNCIDLLTPLLSVVPLQLFAYYAAYNREQCNIDKPKNLAKAVTVE